MSGTMMTDDDDDDDAGMMMDMVMDDVDVANGGGGGGEELGGEISDADLDTMVDELQTMMRDDDVPAVVVVEESDKIATTVDADAAPPNLSFDWMYDVMDELDILAPLKVKAGDGENDGGSDGGGGSNLANLGLSMATRQRLQQWRELDTTSYDHVMNMNRTLYSDLYNSSDTGTTGTTDDDDEDDTADVTDLQWRHRCTMLESLLHHTQQSFRRQLQQRIREADSARSIIADLNRELMAARAPSRSSSPAGKPTQSTDEDKGESLSDISADMIQANHVKYQELIVKLEQQAVELHTLRQASADWRTQSVTSSQRSEILVEDHSDLQQRHRIIEEENKRLYEVIEQLRNNIHNQHQPGAIGTLKPSGDMETMLCDYKLRFAQKCEELDELQEQLTTMTVHRNAIRDKYIHMKRRVDTLSEMEKMYKFSQADIHYLDQLVAELAGRLSSAVGGGCSIVIDLPSNKMKADEKRKKQKKGTASSTPLEAFMKKQREIRNAKSRMASSTSSSPLRSVTGVIRSASDGTGTSVPVAKAAGAASDAAQAGSTVAAASKSGSSAPKSSGTTGSVENGGDKKKAKKAKKDKKEKKSSSMKKSKRSKSVSTIASPQKKVLFEDSDEIDSDDADYG